MPCKTTSVVSRLACILGIGAQLTSAAVLPRGIITDPNTFSSTHFDFIVVGGGTAGLTVAARLAEESWTVGVIEVGQYRPNDPLIDVPKNFGAALGNTSYDWIYTTTPQTNANGRSIVQNRGKVLGGSSAINFEIFNRPASGEYSAWSALNLGIGGWAWDGLLSFFEKTETYVPPAISFANLPLPLPLLRRQDDGNTTTTTDSDDATSIATPFLDSADSALNLTALNVTALLQAAGVADTLATTNSTTDGTDSDSTTDGTDSNSTDTNAARRSELETRDSLHGTSGPVHPSYNTWYSDITTPFINAVTSLGIPVNANPDSGNNVGIYNSARAVDPATQKRSYAAPAYYAPNAGKANFIVLTGAQATKINFGSTKNSAGQYTATGVTFTYNGASYTASASKEIVLSGGVFNTPQLLELSGIGDSDLLNGLGIHTLVDLPGVGENLQDHQMTPVSFIVKPGYHTWDQLRINSTFAADAAAQYANSKTGVLTSTISTLIFAPLQSFLSPSKLLSVLSSITSELLSNASSFSLLQWAQYVIQLAWLYNPAIPQVEFVLIPGFQPTGNVLAPAANTSYVVISPVLQHPFSRGSVHISTTDPLVKPTVNPNYLSSVFDRTILVESVKYIRTLASTAPFSSVIQSANDPPASVTSDDDIAAYTRQALVSLKHPIGTCALAPRALNGVVDTNLLVYGTKNLRVADASIFPMQISAHAQVTTYAIGEKAADIIKSVW